MEGVELGHDGSLVAPSRPTAGTVSGCCGAPCGGEAPGALSFVGAGRGDFVIETNYKYVGPGRGDIAMLVERRAGWPCALAAGLIGVAVVTAVAAKGGALAGGPLQSLGFWQRRGANAAAFATTEAGDLSLGAAAVPQPGELASPQWKLTVDDTSGGERQAIDGFGAAWTDATVQVFDELPAAAQEQLLEELFGSSGIRLGLMRHSIGQSDLTPASLGRWSFDEHGGQPDPELSGFDLTDNGRRMTQWLKRMFEVKPDVQLLGSPWSPPGWMKQDNTLRFEYLDAFVRYFVKYLQAFRDLGVDVHAMTLQNEPLHSSDPAWTTKIDQDYAVRITQKLKPALEAAGLPTEIWAYDHNTDTPGYPEHVLQQAGGDVAAVAWHCYGGGWAPMSAFHEKHPDVKQIMTECWTHEPGESFFDLPGFVTGPLQNWGSGALAWTLGGSSAFDVAYPGGCKECSGIIQVDRAAKSYRKTRDYYTLGQFSRFVARGARYLSGSGSYTYPDGTGVQATQFKNPDGSRVVVIVNKIRNDLDMQVAFSSGDTWHAVVPGRSVTTWIFPGGSAEDGEVVV